MDITHKNRSLLWIAGVILAVLYFTPQAIQSLRQAALYRRQATNAQAQNTSVAMPTPQPQRTVPVSTGAPGAGNALVGIWQGQQLQESRKLCQLGLEIREGAGGALTGYAKLTCFPLATPGQGGPNPASNITRYLSPASAVLAGAMKDGSVAFAITKTIGASVEGCPITAFTVTPFGRDQIATEWQNGVCGKGQIVVQRTGR